MGTQARSCRVQVTQGRGLLEAVQAPLPAMKWGLVSGSPTGGPRALRGGRYFSSGRFGMHAQGPRGGEGLAGEAVRGGIRGGKPPGLS